MDPTARSMILGMRLRQLRKNAGLTAKEIAENWLSCSPSLVYAIEGGYRKLSMLELKGLLTDAYERPDLLPVLEKIRKDVEDGTGAPIRDAMCKHPDAQMVHDLEPEMTASYGAIFDQVPKLTQNKAYMMAQHRMAGYSEEDAEGFTAAGLARQEQFLGLARPPHNKIILTEGALDRAMQVPGQLELFEERAEHPQLEFMVIPNKRGPHFAFASFTVIEFGEFPPLLYSDSAAGSLLIDNEVDIENARKSWKQLHNVAEDRQETLNMIRRRIGSRS